MRIFFYISKTFYSLKTCSLNADRLFPSFPLPTPHSFLLVNKNQTEQNRIPTLSAPDQTLSGKINKGYIPANYSAMRPGWCVCQPGGTAESQFCPVPSRLMEHSHPVSSHTVTLSSGHVPLWLLVKRKILLWVQPLSTSQHSSKGGFGCFCGLY